MGRGLLSCDLAAQFLGVGLGMTKKSYGEGDDRGGRPSSKKKMGKGWKKFS